PGSLADRSCRIPRDDLPGRHVPHDRGSSGDDCPLANGHARTNERIGGDPRMVPNLDARHDEWHTERPNVVAGAAQVNGLRHCRVPAKLDGCHAIAIDRVRNATVGTHREVPWRPDPCARIRMRAALDPGTENTQQRSPPSVKGPWARPIEQMPRDIPECT